MNAQSVTRELLASLPVLSAGLSTAHAVAGADTTTAVVTHPVSVLPGFVEGYSRIHHDEQRHIGYGIWFLREAAAELELAEQIRTTLNERLPATAAALAPPGAGTDFDALGASSDEIREFALGGLTRRLKIIGVPLDTL